jgi:hypothetical protein
MGRASRRKHERATKHTPVAVAAPMRYTWSTRVSLGAAVILVLAAVILFALAPSWRSGQGLRPPVETAPVSLEPRPQHLKDLLALGPSDLDNLDIARVNLLCAEGLPGAEHLNIEQCLTALDDWARRVKSETDRHLYKFWQKPHDYQNSEGYFRMLMLITVLQQDLGVHYNLQRAREVDFTRSEDLFIHGMIPAPDQNVQQTNGGTCVSMPVIYVAVARRLGYPAKLATTKAHVFCRWESPDHANPAWRDRFNIEATNQGMSSFSDDYYKTWPYSIGEEEIHANGYLQSLTPAQELADFLTTRGHCLLDTGKRREALEAYTQAVMRNPANALLAAFREDALRKLNATLAQDDPDRMDSARRRPRPVDPMAAVERINAINRANMERTMRPPTPAPGVPQPPRPGVPPSYQSPPGGPGRPIGP